MVSTDVNVAPAAPVAANTSSSPDSTAPVDTGAVAADDSALAGNEPSASTTAPADEGEGQDQPAEVSYDSLALPEGSSFDDAYLEGIKALAKANSLTPETAQALIERDHERNVQEAEGSKTRWTKQVKDWESEVRADPDIGGDKLKVTVDHAKAAIARFGPPEFAKQVNESGFGNHPGFVRFCAAIGAALGESQTVVSGDPAPNQHGPDYARIFPNSPDMIERMKGKT